LDFSSFLLISYFNKNLIEGRNDKKEEVSQIGKGSKKEIEID